MLWRALEGIRTLTGNSALEVDFCSRKLTWLLTMWGQKPTEALALSRLVTFNAIMFKEGTKWAITCESVYALHHLSSRKSLVCGGWFVVFALNTQAPIGASLFMFCFSLTAVCTALGCYICAWELALCRWHLLSAHVKQYNLPVSVFYVACNIWHKCNAIE